MCGRYTLHGPHSRFRDHFDVEAWPDFADRYNIAPSAWAPVVRRSPEGSRVADLLRWGLVPHWAKLETLGARLTNARSESIADKPSFRTAYRRRRCLVPASGFYEWQTVAGQTWKQPYYITLKGGGPMAMGGLWESWTNSDGEILRTFCVITTGANAAMAPIHDRMPVLLRPADWAAWLDARTDVAQLAPLLAPPPSDAIRAWPVSRKVSRASEEGPELIQPAGP